REPPAPAGLPAHRKVARTRCRILSLITHAILVPVVSSGAPFMMYSFRLAFAFVASTLCSSPTAAQDCADGKCIRIGSYNIRYFASTGPAKTANDIENLSK